MEGTWSSKEGVVEDQHSQRQNPSGGPDGAPVNQQ